MAQNRPFQAYGLGQPLKNFPPDIQFQVRDPNAFDFYPEGTQWINTASNAIFFLTSFVAGAPVWTSVAGGAGFFTSLTVNPGDITITAGNLVLDVGGINSAGNINGALIQSNGPTGGFTAINSQVAGNGPFLALTKTRNGGVITSGDTLGLINFSGADTTPFNTISSRIISTSTGTIGALRVPSNLTFWTTPDTVTPAPTQVMELTASGNVVISAPTSGAPLQLPGASIYTGAGDPNGVINVTQVGDLYINTTAATATSRLFIATDLIGTWTFFTANA